MSRRKKDKPFLFQSLNGKAIKYNKKELKFIDGLKPLNGGEWEGKIKTDCAVRRIDRDAVVSKIKDKLLEIQGHYCIYCGLHEDYCGVLEREHIAPKGEDSYPKFMFEPENLCLACHHCNFDLKKEYDTVSKFSHTYSKNKFSIVHPYFDEFDKYIKVAVKNGRVIISNNNSSSKKGKETIRLFELDSVANTEKRSGLLLVGELKFDDKFDSRLDAVLKKKYMRT